MAINPTYVPIQSYVVSGTSTTSLTFSNISQDYTDLVLQIYARTSYAAQNDTIGLQFNGLGSTYYSNVNVSIADASYQGNTGRGSAFSIGSVSANSSTAGLFGTITTNIFNYSNKTTPKTVTTRYAADYQNITAGGVGMLQGTYYSPANDPITSLTVYSANGSYYFFAGSIVTLYGIKAAPVNVLASPKASGGVVTSDSTYWFHSFLSSGTFIPSVSSLTCDILYIGGGGSGGGNSSSNYAAGGGGGAGGLQVFLSQSITSATTVTVGAGGASLANAGVAGGSSQFGSYAVAAGGGGGGGYDSRLGGNGASGGGGGGRNAVETNTGGTASNGGVGGTGYSASSAKLAGGGGGGTAGSAGGNASNGVAGAGANGNVSYYLNWLTPTGLGDRGYLGGGGGGGAGYGSAGAGTAGIGGNGGGGNGYAATGSSNTGYGFSGMPNTGGGGGGTANGSSGAAGGYGGSGGSGLVIVRYAV
jgi:hypothetical protein